VFGGYSTIEQSATQADGDRKQYALGATYAAGSFTVGYEYTKDSHQDAATGTSYYENNMYGVTFAVNDDLSLSYGVMKSEKKSNDGLSGKEIEADSLQLAYSMGGASLKIAETQVDNGTYASTTANDKDGTTIMLSLAF